MSNLRGVPFIIGVAGGTASGKSSVCCRIVQRLSEFGVHKRVVSISQDSFYRNLTTDEELEKAKRGDFNFDHPDAFEQPLMLNVLRELKEGKSVEIPKYDFMNHSRLLGESERIDQVDVVLVEGILIFFEPELRSMFNLKLFVDADPDIRLARRVERDTTERGRSLTYVLHQYLTLVKPAFEEFCLPTKKYADMIIPRGADNDVAIDLIVQHIQEILRSPPRQLVESTVIEEDEAKEPDSTAPRRRNSTNSFDKKKVLESIAQFHFSFKKRLLPSSPKMDYSGYHNGRPCKACTSAEDMLRISKQFAAKKEAAEKQKSENKQTNAGNEVDRTYTNTFTLSMEEELANSGRRNCPVDKDELGRSTWNLLHTMSVYYPEKPTEAERNSMKNTLNDLSQTYPCPPCAEDLRRDLKSNPPQLEDRDAFAKWMCELHNRVNTKLGKSTFDCSRVMERWYDGWKDGSCD